MNLFQGVLKIVSIETVAKETKKFLFETQSYADLSGTHKTQNQPLPFEAGQFISLKFTEKAWRAYSIASTPKENLIELVIRIVPEGLGSTILDKAQIGDLYDFKGPFGHFILSEEPKANLVFLGTGTGIAPLRSMILTEKEQLNRPMKLLYGGRDTQDIAYLNELKDWAPNLKIQLGLSRTKNYGTFANYAKNCRITEFLESDFENDFDEKTEFYICGNGAMVKSVVEILEKNKVEKKRIFMERFN